MGGVDPAIQYHLATDASKWCLGGVLFQLVDAPPGTEATHSYKEHIRIIMFMSFRLEDAETKYDTTEREALAVVRCLAEVRWLVTGSEYPTKLYTDHSALESIFTQESDAHGRIARWMERLTEYDYEVHHRPCKANIMRIADGMSRLPAKYSQSATAIDLEKMVLTVAHPHLRLPTLATQLADVSTPEPSHQAYQKSNWYGKIISFLLDGPTALDDLSSTEKKAVKQASIKYRVTNQHLLYLERGGETAKCLLPYEIPSILKWAHDEHGHFSNQLTLHKLRGQWYWPTRVNDVEQFCRTCKTCQFDRPRRISTNLRPILSFEPWAMVGMDWIGPIWPPCEVTGWQYILVVVDYFSRFVWARGYENANQEAVHDFWLNFLILVFGFPLCIFHDNGSHFPGAEITTFFESHGTTQIRAPISHLSSVGLVKRNVQLVISQVRKWVLDRGPGAKTIWGRSIPEILPSVNGRLIRLHGFTPAEIMLGFVPEWKVTHRNAQQVAPDITHETTREATPGEIYEIEKGPEGLRIERMIDRRGEQQTLAVRSISENHTKQEGKTRAQ